MSDMNAIAQKLSRELTKYGSSEVTHSRSLFSRHLSERPGISGVIGGKAFQVMLFAPSEELGPSFSAHFNLNVSDMGLSPGHIAFWNADNRFSKIYRQDADHVFLVMDAFITDKDGGEIMRNVAKFWELSIKELAKLKVSYERKRALSS